MSCSLFIASKNGLRNSKGTALLSFLRQSSANNGNAAAANEEKRLYEVSHSFLFILSLPDPSASWLSDDKKFC